MILINFLINKTIDLIFNEENYICINYFNFLFKKNINWFVNLKIMI